MIDNPQIHPALAFLGRGCAASDAHHAVHAAPDPPLPTASWRATWPNRSRSELPTCALTSDETAHFLNTTMGLNLSHDEVTALDNRTEGWIAGLQLAALALREQESSRVAGFISDATSSNRFVVDYFLNEVLQAQEADVRDFLRQTSLLERLSAPLCDAVTARNDSTTILNLLERATSSSFRWTPSAIGIAIIICSPMCCERSSRRRNRIRYPRCIAEPLSGWTNIDWYPKPSRMPWQRGTTAGPPASSSKWAWKRWGAARWRPCSTGWGYCPSSRSTPDRACASTTPAG